MGALILATRSSVVGLGRVVAMTSAGFGAGLIAFSNSRWLPLSILLMMITGFCMMTEMASSNTILQTIVEEDKRGRVMSYYSMAFQGTAPFGSLIAGAAASRIGAPQHTDHRRRTVHRRSSLVLHPAAQDPRHRSAHLPQVGHYSRGCKRDGGRVAVPPED